MDTAPTHNSDIDNDQAELKAACARLRIFAGLVAEAVESIDMPETFLEGERAARAALRFDATPKKDFTRAPGFARLRPNQGDIHDPAAISDLNRRARPFRLPETH